MGAHSDDIEIGCGGTMLRFLSEHDDVEVHWLVLGSIGQRDGEAVASAKKFLADAKKKKIILKHFKESFFPYVGKEIKTFFEKLKKSVSPDIIFTHYRHDLHQDHRLISELTWNTFRDHLILEYEILKYDGDLGSPNLFVHLDEVICQKKIRLIMECFKSQRNKDWFSPDAFLSMLRIRGIECKTRDKYAEGFYCRKMLL
jgi:LmbE family N-acetylglucosaminyl deacetylase